MAKSPSNFFWLAFFKIFSSTVFSLINLQLKEIVKLAKVFFAKIQVIGLPINMHISGLADTMASILRLRIHRRIPIAVVEYNGIGSGQVHTNTAGTCGKYKAEISLIGVKSFH